MAVVIFLLCFQSINIFAKAIISDTVDVKMKESKMTIYQDVIKRFKYTHDEYYVEMREAFLNDTTLVSQWLTVCSNQNLSDQPEEDLIIIEIIKGWIVNREVYESFLDIVDNTDYKSSIPTRGGIVTTWDGHAYFARENYKETILPLCWEAMLKYDKHYWKMLSYVSTIQYIPHPLSLKPLLAFMDRTSDEYVHNYTFRRMISISTVMEKEEFLTVINDYQKKHKSLNKEVDYLEKSLLKTLNTTED